MEIIASLLYLKKRVSLAFLTKKLLKCVFLYGSKLH